MDKTQKIALITRDNCNLFDVNNDIKYLKKTKENTGLLASLQRLLKKNGNLYYLLLKLFAPVLTSYRYRSNVKRLLEAYGQKHVILNLGSGPKYFNNRKDIINVDICKYDEVDIVADITNLPIENNNVDFIINTATLEHIGEAAQAVEEMLRILKPGGKLLCYIPFIVPFHEAPQDFYRWTILGIEKLFSKFEIIEIGIGAGPTSGMLWVLQQWLAILFSFGSKTLHDIIFIALMIITMPIKLIDLILVKFPNAEKIASGFYIVARKSSETHDE